MATSLVTPRMNPALRARVERAVSRKARARHHAARIGLSSPFAASRSIRLATVWPLLVLVALGGLFTVMFVRERRALEEERAAFLSELEGLRVGLPPGHEGLIRATERWLAEAGAEGETTELVDDSLRPAGALDETLGRPALYVRGPAAELRDPRAMDDAVRASDKDAFLLCLLHPPASTSEKDLLAKVRGVYFAGAKVDDETANVRRLAEARVGLGMLAPAFEGRVRAAPDRAALRRLHKELGRAPVELGKRAAAAQIMIVVADKDKKGGARVTIVDLEAETPILQLFRRPEAQNWSEKAGLYHDELEACSLAVAVRRAVAE